jgi:hypothetical protein
VHSLRKNGSFTKNNKPIRRVVAWPFRMKFVDKFVPLTTSTGVQPRAKSGVPCATVRKIGGSVCTNVKNSLLINRVLKRTCLCTQSRDTKKLARKGWDSNAHSFSFDKVSSFGRFPAWYSTQKDPIIVDCVRVTLLGAWPTVDADGPELTVV